MAVKYDVEKGMSGIQPTTGMAIPGHGATYQFNNEFQGERNEREYLKMNEAARSQQKDSNGVVVTSNPPATEPSAESNTLQSKLEAMEPVDKKAKIYQSLSQATCVLSVIFCCWPYNLLMLFAILYLSKTVIHRNEEKDYLSARSNSYILLICNVVALIFGGVVTFAIFVTVLYYVSNAIHESSTAATESPIRSFNSYDYNNFYSG